MCVWKNAHVAIPVQLNSSAMTCA